MKPLTKEVQVEIATVYEKVISKTDYYTEVWIGFDPHEEERVTDQIIDSVIEELEEVYETL